MARTRREILGITVTTMALAGCAGNGDGGGQATTTQTTTEESTPTDTPPGDTQSTPTTTDSGDQTQTETSVTEESTTESTTTRSGATATVRMTNTSFSPHELEVETGTTVVWTNEDAFGHTIVDAQFHDVAESWSFDSGNVPSGGEASYTFDSSGIYEYYCDVHGRSSMCGVVLVGGATLEQNLPCEGGGGIY